MRRVAAVVLAAGLSRRMGGVDKLLLDFQGRPLFEHVLELAAAAGLAAVLVVTNTPAIRSAARDRGFQSVANPRAAEGIASSIRYGLMALPDDMEAVLFLNADQPFLSGGILRCLLETAAAYPGDSIVPRIGGIPCSPCIFPADFRAELLSLSGDCGGRQVYRQHPERVRYVDFVEKKDFWDLDTPADRGRLRL